jgi:hypothetical protein
METHTPDEPPETDSIPWSTLSWWLMLITAVLAIPSLGYVVVAVAGVHGIMGIPVFMACCWACTYFGMHIVKHPNMHEKIDFTQKK